MKWTLAAIACIVAALAGAQVRLLVPSKSLVLQFKEFALSQLPDGSYRFDLRNPGSKVYVASKKQGIELYAPHITVEAVSSTKKEPDSIRNALATGGVRAIQAGSGARNEITGSTAKYVAKSNGASLTVSGPVKLTGAQQGKQNLTASGSSINAELGTPGSSEPLRMATLNGPAHLVIHQAARGSTPQTNLNIDANKIVFNKAANPPTITLSGGVKINGPVGGGVLAGGLERVILTLNAKGEVVNMEGKSR